MSFACLPISRVMLSSPGDASQLRLSHAELPPPAAGEIRVRHTAIGVNYVDIYHRDGLYPLPVWPSPLGVEAAGWVEALGPGVSHLHIGQRVAYAGPPVGSYSSARNLPAWLALPPPACCCAASPHTCCSPGSIGCKRATSCWCTPRLAGWA